jgi:hypothetical protein
MKKHILIWCTITSVITAYCEEKPVMPVQCYISYRLAKGSGADEALFLNKYRVPTVDEQYAYLYANCEYPESQIIEFNNNEVLPAHIHLLCEWLVADAPDENIPQIIEFVNRVNKEAENIQSELNKLMKEKRSQAYAGMRSLVGLGADAMPYYMEFLQSDSEIIYSGACEGISKLFKNKDIPDQIKRKWIAELIETIWIPDTSCRDDVIEMLLSLDSSGDAPVTIKDWVSICVGEKNLAVYEQIQFMHPKEFKKWLKKEGGFRFSLGWLFDEYE